MRSASQETSPEVTGAEPVSSGSSAEPPRAATGLDPVRTDARRGGAVLRYHTWPTIQRQTVAEHSWNLVRILVTIWPMAPASAILYAQFHDTPEVATGDPPYPVKAENPLLKSEHDRLEMEAAVPMGIWQHLRPDPYWRNRVKLCDTIEMWEFGLDEMALGSQFARPIVRRMWDLQCALMHQFKFQAEDRQAHARYVTAREARMGEYLS